MSALFPGTGNWSSGTTTQGGSTSTTKKYFNPQAILDLQNQYRNQYQGSAGLKNLLLYGNKGPGASTGGGYMMPGASAPPSGGAPPVGGMHPVAHAPTPKVNPQNPGPAPTPGAGAGTPDVPAGPAYVPPDVPTGSGGGGGDGGPTKYHGPDQPNYSRYSVPGAAVSDDVPGGAPGGATSPGAGTHGETPVTSKTTILPDGHTEMTPLGAPGGMTIGPGAGQGPGGGDTNPPGTVPGERRPIHTPISDNGGIPLGGGPPPGGPPPGGGPPADGSGGGGLLDVINEMLNGGGYSDAEKQAIAERAAEATAAQKGSAQAQMANHLASSGNAAGYAGAMSSLDNSAAQTASDQARQNTIDFSNEAERRKELGQNALQQLLGMTTAENLGEMSGASGLAGLSGGEDTSHQGGTSFNNQGFQATPDASAGKPKPDAKPGVGGGGGSPPTNVPAGAFKTDPDPNGKQYWVDPNTGKVYDPNGKVVHDPNDPAEPYWDPLSGDVLPNPDPNYVPPDDGGITGGTEGGDVLPNPDPNYVPPDDGGITGGTEGDPYTPPPDDSGDGYLKAYDPRRALMRLLM